MNPSQEPNRTPSEFEKLLAGLARQKIDFAVVGGLAVILNGYPRLTLDADILVHGSPENLGKLLEILKKWGDGYAGELSLADFTAGDGAVRVTEFFDLDIFVHLGGKTLDDFRRNLRFFESDEVRIAYLSPADLIFLKQGSWREKDQLDVAAMKEILAREAK
ncbi:MAG TPA: DUF6036 family nucleotidyltransferase [Verrucomicrobiae bacterium]